MFDTVPVLNKIARKAQARAPPMLVHTQLVTARLGITQPSLLWCTLRHHAITREMSRQKIIYKFMDYDFVHVLLIIQKH